MKTPIISATIVAALTVVGAYYWFGATVDQYPAIALWAAAIWFSLGTVLVMLQYRMAFSAGLLAGAATAFSTRGWSGSWSRRRQRKRGSSASGRLLLAAAIRPNPHPHKLPKSGASPVYFRACAPRFSPAFNSPCSRSRFPFRSIPMRQIAPPVRHPQALKMCP